MERKIQSFNFENNTIRTLEINNETWWIAKDVCESLGYIWKGMDSIRHVPELWRGIQSVWTPSGNQDMLIISEAGLFFFLNRSDKPKALPFQIWIAGEVLPQIRRTGRYSLPSIQEMLPAVPGYGFLDEKLAFLEKAVSDLNSNFSALAFTRQSVQDLHQEYESKPHSKKHGTHRVKCSFQDLYRVEWLTGFWISTLGASITEKEVVTLAIDSLIEKLKLELKGDKPSFALRRTSIAVNPERIPYDEGGQNGQ